MRRHQLSNGIKLFYEKYPSKNEKNNPWVIFISGFGDAHITWIDYAEKFSAAGYNVLLFDNRDVGQSGLATEPYTLEDMAGDVVGLLNGLNIKSAHIVGHSMGASIAQIIALKEPTLVLSLILIAGASSREFINLEVINTWVEAFRK